MNKGKLVIIVGCMLSGKTTKLISIAQDLIKNGKKVGIFHPAIDTRYKLNAISSHAGGSMESHALSLNTKHIEKGDLQVAIIDEVHFFNENILEAIEGLLNEGVDVYIGALNKDYLAKPFATVEKVLPLVDKKIELKARCSVCQQPAEFSYRTTASKDLFFIGGAESYEPRCGKHYNHV